MGLPPRQAVEPFELGAAMTNARVDHSRCVEVVGRDFGSQLSTIVQTSLDPAAVDAKEQLFGLLWRYLAWWLVVELRCFWWGLLVEVCASVYPGKRRAMRIGEG